MQTLTVVPQFCQVRFTVWTLRHFCCLMDKMDTQNLMILSVVLCAHFWTKTANRFLQKSFLSENVLIFRLKNNTLWFWIWAQHVMSAQSLGRDPASKENIVRFSLRFDSANCCFIVQLIDTYVLPFGLTFEKAMSRLLELQFFPNTSASLNHLVMSFPVASRFSAFVAHLGKELFSVPSPLAISLFSEMEKKVQKHALNCHWIENEETHMSFQVCPKLAGDGFSFE